MLPILHVLKTARIYGIHNLAGLQAMLLIHQHGRISVGTISDHCGFSRTSATANADILEKLHLVARQYDPKDRRKVWLELTAQGRELVNRIHTPH